MLLVHLDREVRMPFFISYHSPIHYSKAYLSLSNKFSIYFIHIFIISVSQRKTYTYITP
nr:MAG TPA: hypothetical protein [Caudoviricetes sp.]